MNTIENTQNALGFGSILLNEDGLEVTPEKLTKVLAASGCQVGEIETRIFCNALAGLDMDKIMASVVASLTVNAAVIEEPVVEPTPDIPEDPVDTGSEGGDSDGMFFLFPDDEEEDEELAKV